MLLAACADDDRSVSPQTCQLECERAAQCSPGADGRSCRQQCGPLSDPAPPPLSPRYLDAVRRCLAAVPCNEARLNEGSEACAYEAAFGLKPSKPAEDLCRRAQRSDGLWPRDHFASGTCLDDVKLYEATVLRRAARCYDDALADQRRCLEYVFGSRYPTCIRIRAPATERTTSRVRWLERTAVLESRRCDRRQRGVTSWMPIIRRCLSSAGPSAQRSGVGRRASAAGPRRGAVGGQSPAVTLHSARIRGGSRDFRSYAQSRALSPSKTMTLSVRTIRAVAAARLARSPPGEGRGGMPLSAHSSSR